MDENKKLAIELANALIQNSSVKPVYNKGYKDGADLIVYPIDNLEYSINSIVLHFLESLKRITIIQQSPLEITIWLYLVLIIKKLLYNKGISI